MISELSRKLLKEMDATPYGKALKDFLEDERAKISSVEGCKTLEDVKGRQLALETIKKLFSFMKEDKVEINNNNQYE